MSGNILLREKIERIFEDAWLPEEDRVLWRERLERAGDSFALAFTDLFDGEKDRLLFFTSDLNERILAGDDPKKLASVLEKEKRQLQGN